MSDYKTAFVYNDENNDQALYVDGKLHTANESVYVCDLVEAMGDKPFVLRQIEIDWSGESWPENESELIAFLAKFKTKQDFAPIEQKELFK